MYKMLKNRKQHPFYRSKVVKQFYFMYYENKEKATEGRGDDEFL